MADFTRISPGVYFREFDGTIRPADPVGTATAIISPRRQGPAFEPISIKDRDEDLQVFGAPLSDGTDFGAYAAQTYLNVEQRPLTQIRVLGRSDTGITPGYSVGGTYAIVSSGSNVVALIQSSGAVSMGALSSSAETLALSIEGFGDVTASLHRESSRYIGKVLNTDGSQYADKNHILFSVYDYVEKDSPLDTFASVLLPESAVWTDDYTTASTPTIISQPFDNVEYDLFSIGMKSAGEASNTQVKISISNIKKSVNETVYPYGTFTLLVRRYDDNDKAPVVLESFSGLTLDPESPNYICRRIGDVYKVWNSGVKKFDEMGEYDSKSKYIYIVPSLDLQNENVPETALPYGYSGYAKLSNSAVGEQASFPDVPTVSNLLYKNSFSTRVFWGVEVVNNQSGSLNAGVSDRAKHLPAALTSVSGSAGQKFSLKWLSGSTANVSDYSSTDRLTEADIAIMSTSIAFSASTDEVPSGDGHLTLDNIENTSLAKFTLIPVDGFDALDVTKKNPFDPEDMATNVTYQTLAYKTSLDMLSNADEIEISELVMPGVWATTVVEEGIDMISSRGDAFLIADISGSTVDDVISSREAANYDSSYAASYYPWVRFQDVINNKQVWVPPTVVMPAVYAYSDKLSFPWFAPAGFSRGGLQQHGVLKAKDKLKGSERDKLAENGINPIGTFAGERSPIVWGQKTLQQQSSALDRVNVRRMIIQVRKIIAKIAIRFVFEPNVAATWDRFINIATPELERVQRNFGMDDFRLILDERTTTEDFIERNIIYGKMAIKPTRAAETFLFDFYLQDGSAVFAE